jgi:hypothetical protein
MPGHQVEAPLPLPGIAAIMQPRAIIEEEAGGDERAGALLAMFGCPMPSPAERRVTKILWDILLWSSEGRHMLVPFAYDAGRLPTLQAILRHLLAEALVAESYREDGAGAWALDAADRLCWDDAVLEYDRLRSWSWISEEGPG